MGYRCIDFPMLDNIISIYGIKTGWVGMKIFLFYFEMAINITGSAQNYRVGWVSGNTPIFLGLINNSSTYTSVCIYVIAIRVFHCSVRLWRLCHALRVLWYYLMQWTFISYINTNIRNAK